MADEMLQMTILVSKMRTATGGVLPANQGPLLRPLVIVLLTVAAPGRRSVAPQGDSR